ncbi:hypothetical protein H257_18378 [Aphanomyces astaci]|uniref:Uncharacterized protein n=1 Tax=Aphanomyces astaci TaxID=112090 RepID=W4FDJ7_APHAT|nr:hypothetical protein H257_18378 [Aphanomyces astaci]ETV64803.1 hypothetical protein H257_18378 [Aphanomyces astaci]|eukprot:XP_009845722.1 hypothetical protein H257_18378 [Aphanomyces astaci]
METELLSKTWVEASEDRIKDKNQSKAKATAKPANVNVNVMEATPMEPNDTGESGATMERNKISTKEMASKKAPPMAKSVATVSTYGKAKFNSTPKITRTVWQLPNTATDGKQSLPDAWSEARRDCNAFNWPIQAIRRRNQG